MAARIAEICAAAPLEPPEDDDPAAAEADEEDTAALELDAAALALALALELEEMPPELELPDEVLTQSTPLPSAS